MTAKPNYYRQNSGLSLVMGTEPDHQDSELLRLTLAGNEEALATLYRRRQAGIYRFALQMSGSPALAEDITQEVFVTLMRDGTSYDSGRGPLMWFMLGIARNLMRQRLGREQLYAPMIDDANEGTSLATLTGSSDPLAELSRNETIEATRKVVLSLPPHYREVLVLCELQEMSYVEAAAVLNCKVGTVRSRLHRARALMVEKLGPAKEEAKAESELNTARCFA